MAAQKTSTTAYVVASSMAKLAHMPQWSGYISEEMIRLNEAFASYGCDTAVKRLYHALPPGLAISLMDYFYIPGMVHHYLFRKRFIEKRLITAIGNDARQVIILGAGLDTLALRIAEIYAEVSFIEIDLPTTQQAKLDILKRIKISVPTNLMFVSADLAHVTIDSIATINRQLPTVVILEGVLMYLSENEVKSLFTQLHTTFKDALTIIFGAMSQPDEAGNLRLRLVNRFLKTNAEGTKWHCPVKSIPSFMTCLGYSVTEVMTYKALQEPYRTVAELSQLPAEDENYYIADKI